MIGRLLRHIRAFNLALGHGRRLETFLACVALTLGFCLSRRVGVSDSSTFHELGYVIPHYVLSLPWLLYGACGLYGVVANWRSWPRSRLFRLIASLLGVILWSWVTLVNIFKGDPFATMTAFSFWAAVFSIGAMRTSYLNLPIPGDPGRWN